MPISVRLDEETEALLLKTARALNTTKTNVLKASIRDFCTKTLQDRRKKPYNLITDLVGEEFSGQGNIAIDSEEILRKAFSRRE